MTSYERWLNGYRAETDEGVISSVQFSAHKLTVVLGRLLDTLIVHLVAVLTSTLSLSLSARRGNYKRTPGLRSRCVSMEYWILLSNGISEVIII